MLPGSLVLAAVIFLVLRGWTTTKLRLPPGPRRVPLLGNVHQLPSMGHQKAFAEWGKRYGTRAGFYRYCAHGSSRESSQGMSFTHVCSVRQLLWSIPCPPRKSFSIRGAPSTRIDRVSFYSKSCKEAYCHRLEGQRPLIDTFQNGLGRHDTFFVWRTLAEAPKVDRKRFSGQGCSIELSSVTAPRNLHPSIQPHGQAATVHGAHQTVSCHILHVPLV